MMLENQWLITALVFLIINAAISLLRGISGYAFCGLYGFIGSRKPNPFILKMLGLSNETRGKDANGYYNGESVYKYYDWKNKLVADMLQKHMFEYLNPNAVRGHHMFLGHARGASPGTSKDETTTHPIYRLKPNYKYEEEVDTKTGVVKRISRDYSIVLTHNGNFRGWQAWAKDQMGMSAEAIKEYDFKSDTQFATWVLDNLCWETYPDFLQSYPGDAALVWRHPKRDGNENIIYMFKGQRTAYGQPERPLYVYNHEGVMYWSSLEPILKVCFDDTEHITSVPENILMKIKDGKVIDSIKIDRSKAKHDYTPTKTSTSSSRASYNGGYGGYGRNGSQHGRSYANRSNTSSDSWSRTASQSNKLEATKSTPFERAGGHIHFENLRYCRNGHEITGQFYVKFDGEVVYKALEADVMMYIYNGIHVSKAMYDQLIRNHKSENLELHGQDMDTRTMKRDISVFALSPVASSRKPIEDRWIHLNGICIGGEWTPIVGRTKRKFQFHNGVLSTVAVPSSTQTELSLQTTT